MNTIPVITDDVKMHKIFDITRLTYFSIECDVPSPNWTLILGDQSIPFYLLGLSGIIWKPIGESDIFNSPYLIEQLFNTIEENPSLYVDINDIWLPNFLFSNFDNVHKRGSVYRVKEDLFIRAHNYRENRIPAKQFQSICKELKDGIAFSRDETISFQNWINNQIEKAKKLYPKNSKLKLKWRQ